VVKGGQVNLPGVLNYQAIQLRNIVRSNVMKCGEELIRAELSERTNKSIAQLKIKDKDVFRPTTHLETSKRLRAVARKG
jgi:hypothetical protein